MSEPPPVSPKTHVVAPEDRIPVKEKVAYGVGGVAKGIQDAADNMLIAPVFVLGAGVDPRVMGIAGVLYRVFDAITDAVMGVVSDNTRSRWGRRRPYIVAGTLMMALSMPLIFMFNAEWPMWAVVGWMIGTSLFIYFAHTVYNIPYQAMLYESSPDSHERTKLAAFPAYFGISVQFLMGWSWYLAQLDIFKIEGHPIAVLPGAVWVISGFSILVLLLGFLPALFMRERYYNQASQQAKVGLLQNFKFTFQSRSFLYLIGFTFLFLAGFNMKWTLEFFVRFYYVAQRDEELASSLAGWSSSAQAFTGLAGVFLFSWVSRRIGKLRTLQLIVFITFALSIGLYWLYNPNYPWLMILPGVLFGPVSSAMWVLVPSMIGDIVDEDELKTNERREGAFASIYSWVFKVALTASAGLSGFLAAWAGYRPEIRDDLPLEILERMRLMLAILPSAVVLVALGVLLFYPITEQVIAANRAKLEAKRGKVSG